MTKGKRKQLKRKPNDLREKVDLLNDSAYALCRSNPVQAETTAVKAYEKAKRIRYKRGRARAAQIAGISHGIRGNYSQALNYFSESLKIREGIGDERLIANTQHTIGNVHWLMGDYEKALKYYIKSLALYEEIGDKNGMAFSYNDIGSVYKDMNDLDTALTYHLKALSILESIENKISLADTYNNTGIIYVKKQEYERALELFFRAKALREETGDQSGLANAHCNIGAVYVEQNRCKEALENFNRALVMYEELDEKEGVLSTCFHIGCAHLALKRYSSALDFLRRGLNLAQKIKAKSKEVEGYRLLSELYEARKDFEKALHFYEKHTELERELLNIEKSRQLTEMRVRYEAEKKEREAEIYHLKNVELRKEVRERRRAERRLAKHRDQLEAMVAERTAELEATNVELREEITARRQVEEELLGYQRQLRSLAHELSLVEERQRRRIATVLHDNISQSLMIVKSGLDVLVSAVLDKKVVRRLREIQAQVRQMIERTRSMTFEISPPVLYELGLEPAMEWLVERFQEQHGIECEFCDDGRAKPVSEDWRSILFQATRELLANVRKHAQAERVCVSVCRDGRRVRITVEDDGDGFEPQILGRKIVKNEGFGLFNLQQRLAHLRGKVEIDSQRGRGTKVTLLAPLKRKKQR